MLFLLMFTFLGPFVTRAVQNFNQGLHAKIILFSDLVVNLYLYSNVTFMFVPFI